MTSFTALYAIISLVAIALAAVHEKSSTNGWTLVKAASDNTTLTLSVALVRENLDQLESKLASLATPGHSLYGQWMGIDDIESTFPTVSDIAVTNWLKNAGVTQIHREGSFVNFAMDIGTANKLLNTTFAWYEKGSSLKLRTTEYSIPQDLTSSIDIILPTVFFGNDDISTSTPFERLPGTFPVNSTCDNLITPDCLRDMYQLGDFTPDASKGSRIGYANFLNQSSSYADVELFQATFNLPAHNFSVELINGGVNNQESFGEHSEADLDVELIIALTYPLPVTSFITGGSPPFIPNLDLPATAINSNEPFLPFYEFLLSQPNSALPQVISNSYADDEQTVPERYAKRVCNLIGLIGLRGISVLTSSGDTGVGSACQSNDETKTPQFTPQFPGTCPFITTVGGTQFLTPEVAWDASSGGFSYYFDRPWYQDNAVDQYLGSFISEGTKEYYQHYTNFRGRGFPDVSAHSLLPAFEIAAYGQLGGTGGTSASCPIFSSLISLLNDVRLQAGKPVLGFLNPFLYSIGKTGLNDIRSGGSGGCQGIDLQNGELIPGVIPIPYASWNATYGWDPVTGLGTPNFEKLKELALTF